MKPPLWKMYGQAILNRDGGMICYYCKCPVIRTIKTVSNQATIDHIRPKKRGGKTELDNLVIACLDCNQKKGSKRALDFVLEASAKKSKNA